jgi:predicted nuclease of predicted toxin-antitoxin system
MRFVLDQGLPRSTVQHLRESGHDGLHTAEVDLARAVDVEVLDWARQQDRIVVALDADFHAILALSGATKPSVVRIRIEGLTGEAVAGIVNMVVEKCADDLEAGAAITVTAHSIRVRRLPILGNVEND